MVNLLFCTILYNIGARYTKDRDGYYKFRINGSEGLNKTFGVGIFENLLAVKMDLVKIKPPKPGWGVYI